jgi:hypothetical protein
MFEHAPYVFSEILRIPVCLATETGPLVAAPDQLLTLRVEDVATRVPTFVTSVSVVGMPVPPPKPRHLHPPPDPS